MKIGESFILRAVASLLFFVVNLFAIYLLLRGHNLPGGGFIGGLGSALSFLLLSLAFGVEWTERALRIDSLQLAAVGLGIAVVSAMSPWIVGDPFLRQYNLKFYDLPIVGDLALGTPLTFDLGVFIAVVGVSTKLIFMLARSISGVGALTPESAHLYAAAMEEPVEGPGAPTNAAEKEEERT